MSDVIAALATGNAPCAIGVIRLSGPGCAAVVGKVFRLRSGAAVEDAPNRKLMMGTLYDVSGREIDQALLVYTRGPHSYTGEDTVELQCHGSPAVLAAGLESLFRAGARQAGPGEFTKRAFLNGRMDLTGAEAVIDLIEAQTADMAANAAAQVGGALARVVDPVYDDLTDICSHYHAVLDYPDEDIPAFQLRDFRDTLEADRNRLYALYETRQRGQILKNGVRVVLLGRPNVGKSSLLNALAGYDRVIVTQIAGTTRDTVEELIKFGRVPARIIDTAGIRETTDEIEALGVKRSVEAADDADLAIFLCDGSKPLTEEDFSAMETAHRAKNSIGLINKADLPVVVEAEQLSFEQVFSVSAKDGHGLDALGRYIEALFSDHLPCDGTILTNTRQAEAVRYAVDSLDRCLEALDLGITPDAVLTEAEDAMHALGELTGRTVREDITQRIFARFCVGK